MQIQIPYTGCLAEDPQPVDRTTAFRSGYPQHNYHHF